MLEESHLAKLKSLQRRFRSAIDLLRSHNISVKSLVKEIAKLDPTLRVSESTISQYKKAKKNLHSLKIPTFQKCIDVFEVHLAEIDYFWNEDIKQYEEHNVSEEVQLLRKKLPNLTGSWFGYSYNKERSDDKVTTYNSFRLLILEDKTVECVTQHGILKGKVKAITKDRILIELKNPTRIIYTMGKILSSEKLQDISIFKCGYLDSGASHVRCGEVILIRTKDKVDSIKAASYKFETLHYPSELSSSETTEKFKNILLELKNTQQVINQLIDM